LCAPALVEPCQAVPWMRHRCMVGSVTGHAAFLLAGLTHVDKGAASSEQRWMATATRSTATVMAHVAVPCSSQQPRPAASRSTAPPSSADILTHMRRCAVHTHRLRGGVCTTEPAAARRRPPHQGHRGAVPAHQGRRQGLRLRAHHGGRQQVRGCSERCIAHCSA
jgi:hypothetical protein